MDGSRLYREIPGTVMFFLALLLGVSLAGYSSLDPTFNQQVGSAHTVQNPAGTVGAYLGGSLVELLGVGSLVVPLFFVYLGLYLFWPVLQLAWWRWLGLFFCFAALIVWAEFPRVQAFTQDMEISGGGFAGSQLYQAGFEALGFWGILIAGGFLTLMGIQLATGFSWGGGLYRLAVLMPDKKERDRDSSSDSTGSARQAPKKQNSSSSGKGKKKADPHPPAPQASPGNIDTSRYDLPPLELLTSAPDDVLKVDQTRLDEIAQAVKSSLEDFSVQGEVQRVQPGPVVTMLEYKPAPGVKISRISNLHDDLALALKAAAVRIVAPLPGKDTVGVEIPNDNRQTVYLQEILESGDFGRSKHKLPLALGKDIQGRPRVEDLSRMPHLLVAGATGAGKSVCLNSLLLSLLFRYPPRELKFLLIDPKRIELAVYNDLPHLVHPVVTDMNLAKTALDWAIYEMEKRYDRMAALGVRNIEGYNQKLASFGDNPPEGFEDQESMPYLVIVVDEMADLMLTAGKEVEMGIVRLAQLARAAGIHLVLATQRPSVDVVTGIIKANFPSRIAFQVSSKHDSRTILDSVGAEYLLGHGDMLFKSAGGQMQRIHGAFVQEEEIASVVQFWKDKAGAEFELDFNEWKNSENGQNGQDFESDPVVDDPKYAQAVEFIQEQGKGSISLIQRRFRIGYNKAALFIEQMEKDGILGPSDGSRPRQVLKPK
ncbi:cell division protein FtsK/SpoIIIE [Desulfonatronospira thiodismutans ASO3-1]|uniref:Cell division protein FtsK/SpoIIIE n=1 Tax=Desulfonatronospira thiodismutans ASO3-1 TaxID=555779 RepID=D6SQ27_9BACT|nr:DNA translocase FtsK [Desulfonatronospira thiodismutans]EFI34853.1 cell division protein FtsK/SpoIIIE [Desulfonatronospira thiodismutans ASO3-1]